MIVRVIFVDEEVMLEQAEHPLQVETSHHRLTGRVFALTHFLLDCFRSIPEGNGLRTNCLHPQHVIEQGCHMLLGRVRARQQWRLRINRLPSMGYHHILLPFLRLSLNLGQRPPKLEMRGSHRIHHRASSRQVSD